MQNLKKFFALIVFFYMSSLAMAITIPPTPAENGEGYFIQDYAGIMNENAMKRIGKAQEDAFEKVSSPLILVTIKSMSDYGYTGDDIAEFSKKWFNQWQIGTVATNGNNSGALVMFSLKDRKVRIQLGDDYGHDWDADSERIIDRDMLPYFRDGDYIRGLSNGMESLSEMAISAASGKEPETFSSKQATQSVPVKEHASTSHRTEGDGDFLFNVFFVMPMVIGIGMMLMSFFQKEEEKAKNLRKYGFYLFIFPLFILGAIVFAVLMLMSKKAAGSSDEDSVSSAPKSGGFFGGGFRGGSSGSDGTSGGGASGKW